MDFNVRVGIEEGGQMCVILVRLLVMKGWIACTSFYSLDVSPPLFSPQNLSFLFSRGVWIFIIFC